MVRRGGVFCTPRELTLIIMDTTVTDDFDILDFMRAHAPETLVRCPHDLIDEALTQIGLIVYAVEIGPRGVWKVVIARDEPSFTYGYRESLIRIVRPVLRRIKVLRPKTELHAFPVGQRVGLSFLSDELPPFGVRFRQRTRRGQIVQRRLSYVPLLRG